MACEKCGSDHCLIGPKQRGCENPIPFWHCAYPGEVCLELVGESGRTCLYHAHQMEVASLRTRLEQVTARAEKAEKERDEARRDLAAYKSWAGARVKYAEAAEAEASSEAFAEEYKKEDAQKAARTWKRLSAKLKRERDEARSCAGDSTVSYGRLREQLERERAGAAAMRAAISNAIGVADCIDFPGRDGACQRNGASPCGVCQMPAALSSSAGRDVAERMERYREALDGIGGAGWDHDYASSTMGGDRAHFNNCRVCVARRALADAAPHEANAEPPRCHCADGGPGSYDGPQEDCPVHASPASPPPVAPLCAHGYGSGCMRCYEEKQRERLTLLEGVAEKARALLVIVDRSTRECDALRDALARLDSRSDGGAEGGNG